LILIIALLRRKNESFQGENYRLGDMFKSTHFRNHKRGFNYHRKYFPKSIATEYMLRTSEENNYDILKNIVDRRIEPKILKYKDYLAIHLRVGDVIDEDKRSVDTLLRKPCLFVNGYNYVKPLSYYEQKIPIIKKYKIKKIVLIGGFHKQNKHTKSLEYIDKIKSFFIVQGFVCHTRINEDPDEDFLIMCNSKYFIPSGGGFSRVIKIICGMRGGILI
jgi:hypothetical protein